MYDTAVDLRPFPLSYTTKITAHTHAKALQSLSPHNAYFASQSHLMSLIITRHARTSNNTTGRVENQIEREINNHLTCSEIQKICVRHQRVVVLYCVYMCDSEYVQQ